MPLNKKHYLNSIKLYQAAKQKNIPKIEIKEENSSKIVILIVLILMIFFLLVTILSVFKDTMKEIKSTKLELMPSVNTLNLNFDRDNIISPLKEETLFKYRGIAISKNDAIKLNDYDPKFCDNNYCYYSTPMFKYSNGGYCSSGIQSVYYDKENPYISYAYYNILFNTNQKHFDIMCVLSDCSLKTVGYLSFKYVYLNIFNDEKVKHFSKIKITK